MESERMHAWSHLVLFMMLFLIGLAVLRMGNPTGLAAGNQSITAQGIADLKPFLTAVGLLMGMLIAVVMGMNAFAPKNKAQETEEAPVQKQDDPRSKLDAVNQQLENIRKQLRRSG